MGTLRLVLGDQLSLSILSLEDTIPFNYLYWNFLNRNRDKLSSNHRVGMIYKTYDRMALERKEAINKESKQFLDSLD
jgi:deoxyribodipyrimidine photolyase-related protein